ncbi:transposase InsO family protein [Paraburkholderia sp. 32]
MDCALNLIAGGRAVKQVCDVLGVARSNVTARLARSADWQDGRSARKTDDAGLVEEIRLTVADLPSYGYRRVWGMLPRDRECRGVAPVNAKRVYRVMLVHDLLLQRRPSPPRPQRRHDGKVAVAKSNQRWCSEGFEFSCDNGEPLRVTFALDCCDREAMSRAATTGGH